MNKKLLTVAIGATLVAVPFLVAQADVKLYGRVHASLDNLDYNVPNANGKWFVSSNATRFGIRATEDLGNGMRAIAQGEFGYNTDSGAPTFTNRDVYVGMEGSIGGVFLGNINSATKDIGTFVDLFRNQLGENRALINEAGIDSRLADSITYVSPSIGGLSAKVQFGTEDDVTTDDNIITANVRWTAGPLALGVGYLRDENSGSGAEHTKGYRLGVKYSIIDTLAMTALWQSLKDIGGVSGADRDSFGLGASFTMGNNIIKGQWYRADELDTVSDSGADMIALGLDHMFSKTVVGYVAVAKTDNDSAGIFGITGPLTSHSAPDIGGVAVVPPAGETATGYSIGMMVNF